MRFYSVLLTALVPSVVIAKDCQGTVQWTLSNLGDEKSIPTAIVEGQANLSFGSYDDEHKVIPTLIGWSCSATLSRHPVKDRLDLGPRTINSTDLNCSRVGEFDKEVAIDAWVINGGKLAPQAAMYDDATVTLKSLSLSQKLRLRISTGCIE